MSYDERLRVLYIEDNRDSSEMIKLILGLSGIAVESAATAGEAIERAGSERFDLYLLDSGLPDGSGLALCRTLRVIDPRIPVLFYSANAHVDDIERGMAAGGCGIHNQAEFGQTRRFYHSACNQLSGTPPPCF